MAEPIATVSELVRQLYAGVIESPPWQGFLLSLKRETASLSTLIMLSPPGSPTVNLLSTVGGQAEINSAYRDQLFALDPFINVPDGQVTTLHEYFGAQEVERNDYYTHFMRGTWGVGFVLYLRMWRFRLRLWKDLQRVKQENQIITDRIRIILAKNK